MDIWKEATRAKLRIVTPVGPLSLEQLWGLKKTQLNETAVRLDDELDKTAKKSFLAERTTENKTLKLSFDIVLDVLNTKIEEDKKAKSAADDKAHNEKIMALIVEKEEEGLKDKTVAELKALIKK